MKTAGKIVLGMVLGAGLTVAVFSFAGPAGGSFHPMAHGERGQHHQERMERHQERMLERIGDRLELTSAQRDNLVQAMDELRTLRRDWRDERRAVRDEVTALLSAPVLDQERALVLIGDRLERIEQHAPQMIAAIAGFTDSLDEAQKQQLLDMMERRGRGWRHR